MAPRPRTGLRREVYLRLTEGRPELGAYLQGRKHDRREALRGALALRNEREVLERVRAGRDVCWPEGDGPEPLVTVVVPTHRRPDTIERAVKSGLAQTYERVEVLVVGDRTDEESVRILSGIKDERLRVVNLPHQGIYPVEPKQRWFVAGVTPMNVGLDLAAGTWIANCDDDDELLPNHVEVLLGDAKLRRLEMVHSRFEIRHYPPAGDPSASVPTVSVLGEDRIRLGAIARGSVLYSLGLRFMKYETECWRIGEPADWNLWKRMKLAGVRIGFNESVTYRYHRKPTN
jgi:glycosyltransferase involved in cell wall biosynthesis